MPIYIDNARAHAALVVAAQHADMAPESLPFLWDGSAWTTPSGERRDLALIRSGMGKWLASLAEVLRSCVFDDRAPDPKRAARLRQEVERLMISIEALDLDDTEAEYTRTDAAQLAVQADRLDVAATAGEVTALKAVSDEVLAAANGRATHLLSLASQFGAFRAPMRDPAQWVKYLGDAPRTVHVRTSAVWDAFCMAEPDVVRSLGAVAGKRALFAAMDKRFGARRKLSGYEGWRGLSLDG
ncbi:hypothetical protein ABT075_35270 [Streptomyces sp. NPDC002677]|uniref:hypothetical protein n=1 Tax=Streptomyces sp. NPDC002677 TaxID=3154774 RepID=UPI00332375E1